MLEQTPLWEPIREKLQIAADSVWGEVGPGDLVSVTVAIPDFTFRGLPDGIDDYLFLSRPSEDRYMLGCGTAAELRPSGKNRFKVLSDGVARMMKVWRQVDVDGMGFPAPAFVAFAFAPKPATRPDGSGLPDALCRIPLLTLQRDGNNRVATFSWRVSGAMRPKADITEAFRVWEETAQRLFLALRNPVPAVPCANPIERIDSEPGRDEWVARVARAIKAIHNGEIEKTVLSRRIRVSAPRRFNAARLIATLSQRFPDCVQIAYGGAHGTLVAASPERLVSLRSRHVISEALAGTLRRDPEESRDFLLGEALKHSAKDLHEHRLVVDSIVEGLSPFCQSIDRPGAPKLMRLRALQHLWTPIEARAREGVSVLDLAEGLHPTPAVGGVPRDNALAWMAGNGEQRHGWYTGGFGWIDRDGDGEISVVLRCALLQGNCAEVSAGAGIVADSDPASELEETDLKLRAMLEALEEA
ncbi:MAG: isochorismate synthase [Rhodospirillales bacterium]|nr:isochorismate synthase [Rhodospirillales bacterium]